MRSNHRDVEGIHVVSLYGSWHEMGHQYGSLAKCYMTDVLEYVDARLAGDEERIANARGIADNLFAYYPEYLLDFFAGMGETSGISMDRLKLCNAVEYVEGCFLCSALAVWGDYSDGGPCHGPTRYRIVAVPEDMTLHIFLPYCHKWVELNLF